VIRQAAIALAGSAILATGVWRVWVAEYFGRVDLATWANEHPNPSAPPVELGSERVEVVSTERVIPGPGLPPNVGVQTANNNLDATRHAGRVYLAWRTAPSHFAGTQTLIQVVSSDDEKTWRSEGRFSTGADLREPRFLNVGDRLFLYVARLGKDPFDFEPQGVSVSELGEHGFGSLEPVFEPGYIVWRGKELGGKPLLIAYGGGDTLYSLFSHPPMTVELLTTDDGHHLRSFVPRQRVLERGGGSETDVEPLPDGSLVAVTRNEAGDESGWGSKLCRAPSVDSANWSCKGDPKKYDSPAMFRHAGEVYVVARRTLTPDGRYGIALHGPDWYRGIVDQLAYITTAKRCSLFHYDPEKNQLGFVLDLPSRGDTCYPAVLASSDPSEVVVYDYSSDIEGPELPWAAGQRRPTYVYRHVLKFAAR
jgi:hypothetical protein